MLPVCQSQLLLGLASSQLRSAAKSSPGPSWSAAKPRSGQSRPTSKIRLSVMLALFVCP
ncbi:hypothetical protein Lalb_Chr12g0199161 [Lupinus albus]|uniref:Uncharacterized protein n=1 Tax=Lupinus albus TaxID=3870 RepID=A0A6A4PLJ3_LUPAL|nr:hypothetical protein Lalb_Chr12g0199161 [Lupinus albus]